MTTAIRNTGLVIALGLLIAMSAYLTLSEESISDFGSFVMSGEAYRRGLDPYDIHEELVEETGLYFGFEDRAYSPNLNPPISVYPFSLLAKADAEQARWALRAVSVVLYAGACVALLNRYGWQKRWRVLLWLAAMAPFWYTLWLGQIYLLLFALGAGAWLLLEKGSRPILAGVLLGLCVAIKPNFAIWPLLLLLGGGERRPAVTALVAAAAISAIPLLIDGPLIYAEWAVSAREYPRGASAWNASLVGEAARLGVQPFGYALGAAVIAGAAWLVWTARPSAKDTSALGILAALLVGPLSWIGYSSFVLPLLLSRRWGRWEVAAAATLVLPIWLQGPGGEIRLAGTLLLTCLVVRDVWPARAVAQQGGEVFLPEPVREAA